VSRSLVPPIPASRLAPSGKRPRPALPGWRRAPPCRPDWRLLGSHTRGHLAWRQGARRSVAI